EAKFLRALSYFHLVRNWGAIPLRTEHNMGELALAKSSGEEVDELVLNDLWAAETYLPEQQELSGRPTQAAAKTLLADVYLQWEQFAEAREKAQEVIESGIFSLVTVTSRDDFQKIFGPDVISNPEEIFSLKFARQLGQGNYLPWVYNHPNTGLYSFGGSYAIYSDASNTFHKSWDDGDLRKGLWDMVGFGRGDSALVSRKCIDPQAVGNDGAGNDLPVYRYPEVLLIFAEAAGRDAGAPTEESLEAVNRVRRRAYGQDPSVPSEVDYLLTDYDLTSFVDLVIQEKAYEFQFEGKRWLDLKRTGKAEEMIRKNKGLSIAESHYLWPIPYSELDYNPALDPSNDQNPGY